MLAIRDVMRLIPNDVATLALGLACSAGQFLLSAGTTGKRRALPHARILMHQGSSGIGGSTVEVEVQADDLRHMRDTVLGLIAADTGQPVERIFEDSLHDRWYTAAQAQRVRLHRRHRRRTSRRSCRGADGRRGSACRHPGRRRRWRHERLHDPERRVAASARRSHHGRLLAPAHRAGRLPRHRDRRRRRQRAHRPAAAPRCRQPGPRHPALHQLRGRRSERDARDLRHDAARAAGCRDHLRRAGDRRRRGHARGRRGRQARGAAARARRAASAGGAGPRARSPT